MARAAATVVCMSVTIAVVMGLVSIMLPQLIQSLQGIVATFSTNTENFSKWLQKILANNPELEEAVLGYYNLILNNIETWMNSDSIKNFLTNSVMPNVHNVIAGVSSGVVYVVVWLKNILIGLIAAIYLLNIKHTLCAQAKKNPV